MGVKTLTVITALGLSIIGLVISVYFAGEGRPGIDKCTNETRRTKYAPGPTAAFGSWT